jgi:alpha-glucuronidase
MRRVIRHASKGWFALAALLAASPASAEDGYELWLRYHPLPEALAVRDHATLSRLIVEEKDARIASAATELSRALAGLTGLPATYDGHGGAILLGTPGGSPEVRALGLDLTKLGDEGYLIRSVTIRGLPATVVAANTGAGVLYGSFALIRRVQLGASLDKLNIASAPKLKLRVLDHWDNLDRHVERGYAGQSIWDWWHLPAYKDPRYTDYARANASIGINGAVLNNVNASADSLTPRYIAKAAAVADVLRPWGMKVYLSARWTAPMELGGLKDADPLDPAVAAWWRAKADEIYRTIPDFGGFLVKANSEGQPGPSDYRRTHAQGANMLAAALAPHGGIVMWRAFVYSENDTEDRAKQAYTEFKPLDGQFASNVLVQVKNGAIDFQPREPFHPLFGAMPHTPLMMEFQITKEYLGQSTHLTYLGPLFAETLDADTDGHGKTVADVIEHGPLTGIAGVANIGSDRDWSGSTFNQADWYAYGRLAWDPKGDPAAIATEWAGLTFTPDPAFTAPVTDMMMRSRQAAVDYMTPLGLAHQMATAHHYGPAPWIGDLARPEWNPTYYNKADAAGIGFDRTATGSDAIVQYAPRVAARFADPVGAGENLLWFHHLPWSYRMPDGRSLWATLVGRYDRGIATVADMQATWAGVSGRIDPERATKTTAFLGIQHDEAQWWRDASISYWQSLNHLPLPVGAVAPAHDLAWYKAIRFDDAPGMGK